MAESARFGYLQARLHARHGQRPGREDWRLAEASMDLSHFLDAIRTTALRRWVRGVSADSSCLEIERLMRLAWRDTVEQAAAWAPQDWREALLWLRWLPELPAIDFALRRELIMPWMLDDQLVRAFALEDPARSLDALAETDLAPLVAELRAHGDPAKAWMRAWEPMIPSTAPEAVRAELTELMDGVNEHRQQMAECDPADSGQLLRRALAERFLRVFRRAAGTAAALVAFLGLEGLELERVRANLVTRRLLKHVPEGRSWA